MKLRAVISFLAIIFSVVGVCAEIVRHHFGVADGLSNERVRHIMQDSNGYIWIATWSGVDRFDGYSFINFSHLRRRFRAPRPLYHTRFRCIPRPSFDSFDEKRYLQEDMEFSHLRRRFRAPLDHLYHRFRCIPRTCFDSFDEKRVSLQEDMEFQLQATDALSNARRFITTDHGRIETPVFMPVGPVGSVKAVHQHELRDDVNAEIILGNTYPPLSSAPAQRSPTGRRSATINSIGWVSARYLPTRRLPGVLAIFKP